MDPQLLALQEDLQREIEATKSQLLLHLHNGFDSTRVNWDDLNRKRIFIAHNLPGATAAVAANYGVFFIVPMAGVITSVREVHQVLGTDGGAVTLMVEKLTGTTIPGSGVSVLSATFSLKATINTVQSGTFTLTLADKTVAKNDRLALKLTGTPTTVGSVSVLIELTI